jgi:serine/threonine protein kinase/WD40 repeat protein
MQESNIFKTAVKLPPGERAAYLDQACGVNAALRLEVEGLLRAHESPGEFMHRPPIADMATDYRPGPERPGKRIGPYKLLQYLGEGGMGTVFLAEQSQPVRRMVALKIVKPGMDSGQVLARFEAERQALAILDHPNIAKVFDAGTTQVGLELPPKTHSGTNAEGQNGAAKNDPPALENNGSSKGAIETIPSGRPYFVMELVKGVPITAFCDKNKLSTRQRLELFIPVCNAIQHAHMKGIIHRDIKPSNVLIALYDGKPVPKVIDFGVAKAVSEPLTERTMFTQIGQIVGTFEYMSPEQATLNQLDIDTRSDIYSLGVLLYELLTGMTPLDKDKLRTLALDQMLKTIREQEPMRPSVRLSSEAGALALAAAYRSVPSTKLTGLLRGELDWIVMKCLEKERNRRFITAGSVAEDIERYLRNEPVLACPPSLAYRAHKAYRRNKLAISVTSIIAATLLVATAVSIVFAINANRARRDAEAAELEITKKHEIAEKAKSEAEIERDKNAKMVEKLSEKEEERRRSQYVWDMQIMPTVMETGRIGEMENLLSRHTEDLRGFEWHYWNKQIHNERRTLKFANANAVSSTRFAPSGGRFDADRWIMNELGTRVACMAWGAGPDEIDPGTTATITPYTYFVDVYDTVEGHKVCHYQFGSKDRNTPNSLSMLFSPDGSRLALSWSEVRRLPPVDNEKTARPAEYDQRFCIVDVASGKSLYEMKLENAGRGGAAGAFGPTRQVSPVFFPDGSRLALLVGSTGRLVAVNGQQTIQLPEKGSIGVIDLQAQPARELFRYEAPSVMLNPFSTVNFIISPDGARMAYLKSVDVPNPNADTKDTSETIREWSLSIVSAATGKETATYKVEGWTPNNISAMCFSPDSRKLFFAHNPRPPAPAFGGQRVSTKSTAAMIDAETGKELCKETNDLGFTQAGGPLSGCKFSLDKSRVYLYNGSFNVVSAGHTFAFDTETCKPIASFENDFTMRQSVVGNNRIFQVDGNAVAVRNANTGKLIRTLRGHVEDITFLGMAPNGKTICTLDNTGEYKVWNAEPPQPITMTGLLNNTPRFSTISRLSPDGKYIAGVPADPNQPVPTTPGDVLRMEDFTKLALWETASGRMLNLPLRPVPEEFKNATTTNNPIYYTSNSRFVILRRDRVKRDSENPTGNERVAPPNRREAQHLYADLTVWDTSTGQETAHLVLSANPDNRAGTVLVTPDGRFAIVSDLRSTTFQVIELATGRELWSVNSRINASRQNAELGSFNPGDSLTLSPDGRCIVLLGRIFERTSDGRVRVTTATTNARCTILETATGKTLRTFDLTYEGGLLQTWSPDGKRLVLTSSSSFNRSAKLLRVIDFETGKEIMSINASAGSNMIYQNTTVSPDGRRIAAIQAPLALTGGSRLGGIKVWDAATGQELLFLPWDNESGRGVLSRFLNSQIAFTADGNQIVQFAPRNVGLNTPNAVARFIDATPIR